MRLLLVFFSIVVAFLSIIFKDSILSTFESLTQFSSTNTSTSFEGLPVIPPPEIHASSHSANMLVPRAIRKAFLAIEQAEGAGARVRRSIGTPQLRNFSPFLMLDHFTIKPGAGFPDHPHRGQGMLGKMPRIDPYANLVEKPSPTSSKAPLTTKTLPATRAQSKPEISNL